MTDQQPPQAAPPSLYPHYAISDNGLKVVHQEIGRLFHLAAERGANVEALLAERQKLLAENAALAQPSNGHAPLSEMPTIDGSLVDMVRSARKKGDG